MPLIIEKVSVSFKGIDLVRDARITVGEGERVAVVGESGSGKTLTALSVLKLLPRGFSIKGKVEVDGVDVTSLKGKALERFRWKKVSMIFQDPSSAFNPLMKVKDQIGEVLLHHHTVEREKVEERVKSLLRDTEIPDPDVRMHAYPHQLSGGLKQRVAIAMALACNPSYIVADEPTSALDVTVEARILRLLEDISLKGTGILLITHDMGVVSEFSQRVFVMYAGYTVEAGRTQDVLSAPLHPYTEGLIRCSPEISKGRRKLFSIPGSVPEPGSIEKGCPFHPRCPLSAKVCRESMPPVVFREDRWVRCHAVK